MTNVRHAHLSRLKPECVEDYIRYHQNVWPALEEVYHQAGVTDITCYVCGTMLVVTIEVDTVIYNESQAILKENPVERQWQAEMAKLRDPDFKTVVLDEVYRLPPRVK